MFFGQEFRSTLGFVIHPKNTNNLVLIFPEFLLTIVKCLVIDITVTDSVNASSFCHIYLHLGIPTFLG